MSMIGNYLALDEARLQAVIAGEEDILELEERAAQNEEQSGCMILDIDKTWQAIQYLLCKDIDEGEAPMGYVVPMMVDNALDCELDFGAFYLAPGQVREACGYLETLDDDTIKSLYDFKSMKEEGVYPIIEGEDEDEFYQYIYAHLMALKDFYIKSVNMGFAIIFYVM